MWLADSDTKKMINKTRKRKKYKDTIVVSIKSFFPNSEIRKYNTLVSVVMLPNDIQKLYFAWPGSHGMK